MYSVLFSNLNTMKIPCRAMACLAAVLLIPLMLTGCSKPKVQYGQTSADDAASQEVLFMPNLPSQEEMVYTRQLEPGQRLFYRGGLPFCRSLDDLKLVLDLLEQADFKAYKLLLASGRCRIKPKRQVFFVVEQNEIAAKAREQGTLDHYWVWKGDLVE